MHQIQMKLENFTERIKSKEKQIVVSFVEIGKELKEVRDKQIYKEKYSEFGDYVNSSGFKFSERHAYRMIAICEEFSDIDVTKFGITKTLELLKLPAPERQQLIEEKDIEEMSVRELKEEVEDKKIEIEEKPKPDQQIIDVKPTIKYSDKVELLDSTLDYLSEELDNVFSGLENFSTKEYKTEYSKNKEYFVFKYQNIDVKLREVSEKLRKAKMLLSKLKRRRR